jgi:hypothetical protein
MDNQKKCAPVIAGVILLLLPNVLFAQSGTSWAEEFKSLHLVLLELYNELMPLCSQLIGVGRGIAAFGALFYIAYRVWGHIARAESIDFYPLFRPFVIGFVLTIFPSFITLLNGILQPTATGTAAMVENSNAAIVLLAIRGMATAKNGTGTRTRMRARTMKAGSRGSVTMCVLRSQRPIIISSRLLSMRFPKSWSCCLRRRRWPSIPSARFA